MGAQEIQYSVHIKGGRNEKKIAFVQCKYSLSMLNIAFRQKYGNLKVILRIRFRIRVM